jgi:phosphohistidine phosphatase
MKSLLILRHADATAPASGVDDFQRSLSRVGQRQARDVGRRLRESGIAPDAIVCSAARRARQTAELVAQAAQWVSEIVLYKEFYNATCDDLVAHMQSRADDINQLCIIAHAPGVAELVSYLTTRTGDFTMVYAAGTLAEVVLDVDQWSETSPGCGTLRSLTAA